MVPALAGIVMTAAVLRKCFGAVGGVLVLAACQGEPPAMSPAAQRGAAVFDVHCAMCHSMTARVSDIAPRLDRLLGNPAASEDFAYSPALRAAGFVWTEERLDAFLERPREVLPDNQMAFFGMANEQDRQDLVAYIVFQNGG